MAAFQRWFMVITTANLYLSLSPSPALPILNWFAKWKSAFGFISGSARWGGRSVWDSSQVSAWGSVHQHRVKNVFAKTIKKKIKMKYWNWGRIKKHFEWLPAEGASAVLHKLTDSDCNCRPLACTLVVAGDLFPNCRCELPQRGTKETFNTS